MSNAARKALQEGFAELDVCIQRVSAKTGLNPAQIVERWDATKTRVANSWNIYQGFFEEQRDQELARLDPKDHPPTLREHLVLSPRYLALILTLL